MEADLLFTPLDLSTSRPRVLYPPQSFQRAHSPSHPFSHYSFHSFALTALTYVHPYPSPPARLSFLMLSASIVTSDISHSFARLRDCTRRFHRFVTSVCKYLQDIILLDLHGISSWARSQSSHCATDMLIRKVLLLQQMEIERAQPVLAKRSGTKPR